MRESPVIFKLIAAAVLLVVVAGFLVFYSSRIALSGLAIALMVCIAFVGIFHSAPLQLLWGWTLAINAGGLLILGLINGSLIRGILGFLAAAGAVLLLRDRDVKQFRQQLKERRHSALR